MFKQNAEIILTAIILGLITWGGMTLQGQTVEFGKVATLLSQLDKSVIELQSDLKIIARDVPLMRNELDHLKQRVDKLEAKK